MRKRTIGLLLAILPVLLVARAALSQETLYKWVDDQGGVHVSSDLGEVPEEYRGKVEEKVFDKSPAAKGATQGAPAEKGRPKGKGSNSMPDLGGGASPSDERPAAGSAKSPGSSEKADKNGHDAAWWGAKAKALRDQKRVLENKITEANKKIYSSRITEKDEGHREKDALQIELKRVDDQLDRALPAEAEAAGADPAWVR